MIIYLGKLRVYQNFTMEKLTLDYMRISVEIENRI